MGDAAINVRLGAKTKEFNTKLNKASRKLKKFGKSVSGIGRSMATNFTMPILAAGIASVKLSLDFEKSMTKIETLVGRTSAEVAVMKEGIIDMANATAKSPVELAEGLYFLQSAGLSGANAMETLSTVAKGSASGLGDMESLSIVAAAAQNAYGQEVLSASDALDKFGVMVRTGMFDSQELANVLGRQLGLASSLGISFDEVGAIISTYTATTGDATAATNGLSAIMMTFAKLESEPTRKQAEALDKIGMSASSLKTMMGQDGLLLTMQHLQTQFEANNVPMASFFTSSQALKGALGVLGTQSETLTNNFDAMSNSTDFVADAFATTADKDAFKMEQAINSLKVAGTELGNSFLPIVQSLTEKILALTGWWSGLDTATQDNYASWAIWVATVGPALLIFGGIVTKVAGLITLFQKFAIAQKIVTAAQWLFNVALTANPIGLVIVAIAALIAAGVYLATSSSKVAQKFRDAFSNMANQAIFAVNKIISGLNKFASRFGYTIPFIKQFKKSIDKIDPTPIEDTSKAVLDLGKNLNNPDFKGIVISDINISGKKDGDEDDDADLQKSLEKKEAARFKSAEKIRRFKQQFGILNAQDEHSSQIKSLRAEEVNALLQVEMTENTQAEIAAIEEFYALKKTKLLEKQKKENKDKAKATATDWEKTYAKMSKAFQQYGGAVSTILGEVGGLFAAQAEKEQTILENKQANENEDEQKWYDRELAKLEASGMHKEQMEEKIAELDRTAASRKEVLQKKQDGDTKALQIKAAKRDKQMKVMSAIMGTAQAVVSALGSVPAPANFVLAGIVGALGAAQVAAISSTPIPALADGGIAFGPTLAQVGEYSGASANPEVIAPLNKLRDLIGNKNEKQSIEIFGKISGNDIFVSNSLAAKKRLRYT